MSFKFWHVVVLVVIVLVVIKATNNIPFIAKLVS